MINASIDDVLEVFSRLNSYTVALNHQELRHAKFQGEFKWSVRSAVRRWPVLWEGLQVVTQRNRTRMMDDELMAQMFGILIDGVKDGGQPYIEKLYSRFDSSFPEAEEINQSLDQVLNYISSTLVGILEETAIRNAPHFLLFFAAVAHQLLGIPKGDIGDCMPMRSQDALSDTGVVANNIGALASVLEMNESEAQAMPDEMLHFWAASRRTTQRISSRRPRFIMYCQALLPQQIWGYSI